MNTISFPGLGIGPFTVNEIAFQIPFLNTRGVAWYGIIITVGMILAFIFALHNAKKEGMTSDDVIDAAIAAIICGVIGARLYYVVFKGGYTSFYDIIAIWNGGIAIYGGIIGGGIAVAVVALVKKINILKYFDLIAPSLLIGQAIGRWGNFFNAEAYGAETKIFLRMGIEIDGFTKYYHPTFLYESVWNLLGLIVLILIYRKKKFNGQIFFTYVAWYGLGRMFIEGLRTDSLYCGTIRISQLLAFVSAVASVIVLIILANKAKKDRMMKEAYETQYSGDEVKAVAEEPAAETAETIAEAEEAASNAEADAPESETAEAEENEEEPNGDNN